MKTRSGRSPIQKSSDLRDRRLTEIKNKLQEIGDAIRELDSIKSATDDALLNWLRGPVHVSLFHTIHFICQLLARGSVRGDFGIFENFNRSFKLNSSYETNFSEK